MATICRVPVSLLLAIALASTAPVAHAARWVEVGSPAASLDRVSVDTDSVQAVDALRLFDLMTAYPAPRKNAHDILMDRHIQRTAINCAERSFVAIQTSGYLGEKRVGSGPELAGWRQKLAPLPGDPMATRVREVVCAQPLQGGPAPANAAPKVRTGSGMVVDRAGHVLTNSHVVAGCKTIVIKATEGAPVAAVIDGIDPKNDLAVLATPNGQPVGTPVVFRNASKPGKLGESVGVIGYPLAGLLSSEPKATFGQINSVAGMNNDYTLLQISAPVQPGNSGGPLLDQAGLVVGIVVSQASPAVAAITGSVPQNVNFAIRGEVAQIFLAARKVPVATASGFRTLATDEIAAIGVKSTVLIVCAE